MQMKYCRCKADMKLGIVGKNEIKRGTIFSFEDSTARNWQSKSEESYILHATDENSKNWMVYLTEDLFAEYFEEINLCMDCAKCAEWEGYYYCEEEREAYVNGETDSLVSLDKTSSPYETQCYSPKS